MHKFISIILIASVCSLQAQTTMTPELLWQLGRVTGLGITEDGKSVIYSVNTPNVEANKGSSKMYQISIDGGKPVEITKNPIRDKNISPDGKYMLSNKEVNVVKTKGTDFYPELTKSNAYVFNDIPIRHWDTWEEGAYDHVFLSKMVNGEPKDEIDLMPGEPYDCPQKPFGGDEDYIWSPESDRVIYVTKKKYGKDYAVSTNTDLYAYNIATGQTKNLTEGHLGYDVNPEFSKGHPLTWLGMNRDGYESDKQDIYILMNNKITNATGQRDDIHVEGFKYGTDDNIYFYAPINGTLQLFTFDFNPDTYKADIVQVTKGDFDINNIVGQVGDKVIVSRCDMNHANELYSVSIKDGSMKQLTHVNDDAYSKISMVKTERKWVETTDHKKMLVWVVYPPNFDPAKKYPTLLYCQGGPQSALTQFYSFRWNFQLMASNGYIVVAPNRRGMPGHGTEWNEEISKDHGGQAMKDYLSAIDNVSKEHYVDKDRLGCVGASYGGYSAFMLAGIHDGRFKTFIAHDGIFDMRSMYGTTEELWFVDWDWGGPYWDKKNKAAQKTYKKFNPINYVDKWDTPIMIVQGGKDYRVPVEQGIQAFQAAQLKGIKSKLLYLPDENHWVLSAQNAMVWQHEFYNWLKETLPSKEKQQVPMNKS
ncbi:MAG: S9 family peptidase [Saprospiraceae bacterium]|uniref:S9 family peptidase n=1 Tax=Candidatus Opimibacter skivensis TaxID=2982028 RepID=A0A9D7SV55_9BACT|nr:S9 family peptidase [Candidatus Opimibacter skivensis]